MGDAIDTKQANAAIYTLAVASNYGAFSSTISASLAGLLWVGILKEKGIHVKRSKFFLLNVPLVGAAMIASCLVIIGEVYIIYPNIPYPRG